MATFNETFFTLNYKGVDINFPKDIFNEDDVLAGKQPYKVVVKENGFTFAVQPQKELKHAPAAVGKKLSAAEIGALLGV